MAALEAVADRPELDVVVARRGGRDALLRRQVVEGLDDPPPASITERDRSILVNVWRSRPAATGWLAPSGATSESTATMSVSGEVLRSRTFRAAGPTDITGAASGGVV